MSYFLMNKESDYHRGYGDNIRFLSPGITLDITSKREGYYFTRVFDSREKKTEWQQLLSQGNILSEASVTFYIYAAENAAIEVSGQEVSLEEYMKDPGIPSAKKMETFAPYKVLSVNAPRDILLHQVKGRYLWIAIHLKMQGEDNPQIYTIKISFPKQSLMKYLPAVYQEDNKSVSFLERYLEIFETLYSDINEKIRHISFYFDPDNAPGNFPEWLAEWISIEDGYLWDKDQLKYLLNNAMRLYKIRGTRRYLEEIIELYIRVKPFIIEYHELEQFKFDSVKGENLEQLYGKNEYVFTVVLNLGRKTNDREYRILTRLINLSKPAHMGCKLVILDPYIYLSKYSYLGINSILGSYSVPLIDNRTSMTYMKLEKKEEIKVE